MHHINSVLVLSTILLIFIINFYRTPSGSFQFGINEVVAPCYGTVYKITQDNHYVHITCFLSPIDIHMQYSPLDGVVHSTEYDRTGKFHLAYDLGKSRFNEKRIHQIDTTWGPVTIMQIAGFLTRRIDSWIEPGQYLNASQPLGFIHLGSRVDLILPANGLTLEIKKGDKLQGGKKRIGYYEFKSLPNSL